MVKKVKTMDVMIARPVEAAEMITIPNTYEAVRDTIGGIITTVNIGVEGTVAYVHDEGLLIGLPWNRRLGEKFFVAGPILVVGSGSEGEDKSLNKLQQAEAKYFLDHVAQFMIPNPSSIEELEEMTGEKAFRVYVMQPDGKLVDPDNGEEYQR
jgi:hypothetical protein